MKSVSDGSTFKFQAIPKWTGHVADFPKGHRYYIYAPTPRVAAALVREVWGDANWALVHWTLAFRSEIPEHDLGERINTPTYNRILQGEGFSVNPQRRKARGGEAFPTTVQGQRDYVRRGGCGDHYPQEFRDTVAGQLARPARTLEELCTAVAGMFSKWQQQSYGTQRLRHHVSGAIGRSEAEAIAGVEGRAPRSPAYNARAVDQAIDASKRSGRPISGKEARAIHGLLRGRVDTNPGAKMRFTIDSYASALYALRRVGDRGRLGNNTRIEQKENGIAVVLHTTPVVIYHADGTVSLNSGGWQTVTTKARMNEVLPAFVRVFQKQERWLVQDRRDGSSIPFFDGMRIKV